MQQELLPDIDAAIPGRESLRKAAKDMEDEENRTVWTGARRWSSLISFERKGVRGQRAMHSSKDLVLDVLPGRHSIEAIVDLSDLPSLKGAN